MPELYAKTVAATEDTSPDLQNDFLAISDVSAATEKKVKPWRLARGTKGTDIASASTINLDNATGDLVDVTGTTAITAITLAEGRGQWIRFTGILTFTHGASLVLPGGANITTAAGDFAYVRGYASSVVRCLVYQKASGQAVIAPSLASTTEVLTGTDAAKAVTPDALAALWEKGSDIASAGTISIGEGGLFHVTGTTTITDIDPATDKAGRPFILVFDGALTLTHHATTLILPGGINITTAAGDVGYFVSEGSDAVRCVTYRTASGSLYLPIDQHIYINAVKALSYSSGSGYVAVNEGLAAGTTRIYGSNVFLGSSLATYVSGAGQIIMAAIAAPSSAGDTGTAGMIRWDANYIYICTATNTWKRVAIATW